MSTRGAFRSVPVLTPCFSNAHASGLAAVGVLALAGSALAGPTTEYHDDHASHAGLIGHRDAGLGLLEPIAAGRSTDRVANAESALMDGLLTASTWDAGAGSPTGSGAITRARPSYAEPVRGEVRRALHRAARRATTVGFDLDDRLRGSEPTDRGHLETPLELLDTPTGLGAQAAIRLTPTPGAMALMGIGGLGVIRRRGA